MCNLGNSLFENSLVYIWLSLCAFHRQILRNASLKVYFILITLIITLVGCGGGGGGGGGGGDGNGGGESSSNVEAIDYEDEPSSPGIVTLTGASETSFNPTGADVRFEISGASFSDEMALFHNGQPVPDESLVISPNAVTALKLLVEGRNDLTFVGQDSNGGQIYEDFTLWVGSYTLVGTIIDENGIPVNGVAVTARLGDDQQVSTTVTSANGQFTFMNLPGRTIFIDAVASNNRVASIASNGAAGFVQLQLTVINSPSPIKNNDFSLGTEGWNIGSAPVQLMQHVEGTDAVAQAKGLQSQYRHQAEQVPDMDLILNTQGQGPQTISYTFLTLPGIKNVTVRYRFITSEVPGGYFGTEFNDYFNVSIRSQAGGGVVSESNSMNGLGLAAFDASGATAWREIALPISVEGDVVQVNLTVANVADDLLDSQLQVDFVAEKKLNIALLTLLDIDDTPLTYLSADEHTYFNGNTRIHGMVTVEGAKDDGLASLVLEIIQGGGVVATADLAQDAQSTLIQPFGEDEKVEVTTSQLLFNLPSAQAAAVNGTADGTLTLRARARSTNGEEVTKDAGKVQLLVKYDRNNRYGPRNENLGGDDWAQPSFVELVNSLSDSYPDDQWNDFSNMNGGPFFPPHKSHRTGLDVDGRFPGYNNLNAATAETIIGHLNSASGSQVLFVFVTFEKQDTNPFWVAIRNVTLDDGRQARAVIRPQPSHTNHFHVRKK